MFDFIHGKQNRGKLKTNAARFYAACTLEALAHLHSLNIMYRDLKPENLLINSRGYLTVCDFGFSKLDKPGEKNLTTCGTPEYLAPEVIKKEAHGKGVDYWALGVLIYEMHEGENPFAEPGMLQAEKTSTLLRQVRCVYGARCPAGRCPSLTPPYGFRCAGLLSSVR